MASLEDLSARSQAGQAGVSLAGFRDPALIAAALEANPGISQLAAFTILRGSNTILKGPFHQRQMPDGFVARNKSRLNPRNLFRMPYIERMNPNLGNRTFGGVRDGRVVSTSIFGPSADGFKTPRSIPAAVGQRKYWDRSLFQSSRYVNFGLSKFLSTERGSRSALAAPLRGVTLQSGNKTGVPFASGGFYSTQVAAGRLGISGSQVVGANQAANVANFLKVSNPNMFNALSAGGNLDNLDPKMALAKMDRTSASQLLRMSGQGLYNQFLGGAMAASKAGITDTAARFYVDSSRRAGVDISGRTLGTQFARTMAGRGAVFQAEGLAYGGFTMGERMGVRGFASGVRSAYAGTGVEAARATFNAGRAEMGEVAAKVGARGIGIAARRVGQTAAGAAAKRAAVGMGARFAGRFALAAGISAASGGTLAPIAFGIMTAWMIYDVAKLGGTLTGMAARGTVKMAGDAVRSFEGGINKAPMSGFDGFGYRDTEVAATSRQRGVMAIQNSRLNARSILGSEAGMMHAHFG